MYIYKLYALRRIFGGIGEKKKNRWKLIGRLKYEIFISTNREGSRQFEKR